MERKVRRYEASGIVVEFEAARCIHAEECVHGLPAVFDPKARPWVDPSRADAEAIAEVVRRCPTGALQVERRDGGAAEPADEENTVRVTPDGPLHLRGRLRLHLPDGTILEETRAALCRCGGSQNKPFCDDAHVEAGFADPGAIVEHRLGSGEPVPGGALEVRLAANGPILISGPVRVLPAVGEASDEGTGVKGALCRCGASQLKPYCDGTHKTTGFEAE